MLLMVISLPKGFHAGIYLFVRLLKSTSSLLQAADFETPDAF
jgi:hypothetical protein